MNGKTLLAALVGGVAHFLLGWLVYGMALMSTMQGMYTAEANALMKDPPELWAYGVSSLVWALLLAVVFSRWASISTFRGGLIAGAIIGLLTSLSVDLGMHASVKLLSNLAVLVIDPIANAVVSGLAGGVVGWMLGRGAAK